MMSPAPLGFSLPFNLQQWIDEHRAQLKPPVCNKQIFQQDDYIVMVVGGPNNRADYHYNETPELFYQLEGEMVLKIVQSVSTEEDEANASNAEQLNFIDIPMKAGDIFLLPAKVLHSPQRSANGVGLVVEQKRAPGQLDALFWFCPQCNQPLYNEKFALDNIETDLPIVFANFYGTVKNCTCGHCGHVSTKG